MLQSAQRLEAIAHLEEIIGTCVANHSAADFRQNDHVLSEYPQ